MLNFPLPLAFPLMLVTVQISAAAHRFLQACDQMNVLLAEVLLADPLHAVVAESEIVFVLPQIPKMKEILFLLLSILRSLTAIFLCL